MKSISVLPRLDPLSVEQFDADFLQTQQPCILTHFADWPATKCWDRNYLRGVFGDAVVSASQSINHMHPDLSHAPSRPPTIKLRMADYIDLIWSGDTGARNLLVIGDSVAIYSARNSCTGAAPALRSDIEFPRIIDRKRLHFVGIWLSAQGVESRLHYDANGCHNVNVQVRGNKDVWMCSPNNCEHLYQYSRITLSEDFGQFSRVDPFMPDPLTFPHLSRVDCWTGRLDQGDALFIPAYWYHAFRHNGEVNINVNYWWLPERQLLNGITVREAYIAALSRALETGATKATTAVRVAELDAGLKKLVVALESAILDGDFSNRSA